MSIEELRVQIALTFLRKHLEDHSIYEADDEEETVKEDAEAIADLVCIYTNEFMRSFTAAYNPNKTFVKNHTAEI